MSPVSVLLERVRMKLAGLVALFGRHLRLRSDRAERDLGVSWTPYAKTLPKVAEWWMATGHPVRHAAPLATR